MILETITDPEIGCISDIKEIGAVGHRMVHGGEDFAASVLVDEDVMKKCEINSELAPLHNPGKHRRRTCVPGCYAGCSDGSRIRYGIPSDDGAGSLPLMRFLMNIMKNSR